MTRESQAAFNQAIDMGILSADMMNAPHFAGNYMFMSRDTHGLAFKNIITRQYVHCPIANAA